MEMVQVHDDVVDTRAFEKINGMDDIGNVQDGKQRLGDGVGCGKKSGAESGAQYHRFASVKHLIIKFSRFELG
jgi:hypothetical protein